MNSKNCEEYYEYNVDLLKRRLVELFENAKINGISANKIAKEIQIGRSTVSKYIAGTALPSIPVLVNLARYFNVSTDYLLGLTNAPSPNLTERAICEATGLTIEAIENCKKTQKKQNRSRSIYVRCSDKKFDIGFENDTSSQFIKNAKFCEIIQLVSTYASASISRDIKEKVNAELSQSHIVVLGPDIGIIQLSDRCDLALYRISRKIEAIANDIIEEYSRIHAGEIDDVTKLAVKYMIDKKRENAGRPHDNWVNREEN